MYFGLIILRVPQGLDYSQIIEDEDSPITMNGNETNITQTPEDKPSQSTANQLTQGRSKSESVGNSFTDIFIPSPLSLFLCPVFLIVMIEALLKDYFPDCCHW